MRGCYNLLINKSRRDINISAEVPVARRVKGKVGCIRSTIVLPINNRAKVPESPSGCRRSAWDVAGGSFEEVDPVQRVAVSCASQECEPHQQKTGGHPEEACKA